MSALKKGDHLYLVDGSGYLFRAYHALPPLTRKSDGLPTGAVSGYCNMLWKLLEDMKGGEAPTHLAVIFDAGEKTFRNDIYKAYKANRPPPPEDLVPQFNYEFEDRLKHDCGGGWPTRRPGILPPLCSTHSDLGFCLDDLRDNDVWTGRGGGMWSTVGRGGVR